MEMAFDPTRTREGFRVEHVVTQEQVLSNASHYHGFLEIYLYLGEGMSFWIDDQVHLLKKHDIVFIPPFVPHRTAYEADRIHERIMMFLDESVIDAFFPTALSTSMRAMFARTQLSIPDDLCQGLVALLKDRILPAYADTDSAAAFQRSLLLAMGVMAEILERFEKGRLEAGSPQPTSQEKKVSEAIEFIHRHYMGRLTLELVSRSCFVDKFYLCHIFKRATGIGINRYINQKRLLEAEKLLRSSSDSILGISKSVGFGSPSRFISLFREKNGCTPHDFRIRYAEGGDGNA
jgi:AraC-like DNA-binding protein